MAPRLHLPTLQLLRSKLNLLLPPFPGRLSALCSENFGDVVIISIEIECDTDIRSRCRWGEIKSKAWVSILDTRLLSTIPADDALTTHNFATGTCPADNNCIDSRCLLGDKQHTSFLEMLQSLKKLIDQYHNIIIVSHGLKENIPILTRLGLEVREGGSTEALIDTKVLAFDVLGFPTVTPDTPLEVLLQKIQLPLTNLRIAGNKADSNLRAILLLLVESYRGYNKYLDEPTRNKIMKMQAIAQSQLPRSSSPPPHTPSVPIENKYRIRIRKSRRKAPKVIRSIEEQEQVRATRAARAELTPRISGFELLFTDQEDESMEGQEQTRAPLTGVEEFELIFADPEDSSTEGQEQIRGAHAELSQVDELEWVCVDLEDDSPLQ